MHTPVHASWLNQIELYFSILQRKVLTPNDFADLPAVEARLLAFADGTTRSAGPSTGASPAPTWSDACATSPTHQTPATPAWEPPDGTATSEMLY